MGLLSLKSARDRVLLGTTRDTESIRQTARPVETEAVSLGGQ
jgi:hypothetical protein